jgi:threonine dehydratase
MEKKDIDEVAVRMKDYGKRTDVIESTTINEVCGCRVFLKMENFQRTGSFKLRGAANRLLTLKEDEKEKGIITASTGNHGQAVAYMAKILGIECKIIVPKNVKKSKIDAIRRYGVKSEVYGNNYDDAFQRSGELAKEEGYVMINSYEDEEIIAGNGTISLEMPELDTLIVPVGGGGLLTGMLIALEGKSTKVMGVEPEGAACMHLSLKNGRPSSTPVVDTIADGLAAKHPGIKPFNIIKGRLSENDLVLVNDKEIASTVLFLLERRKILAEPSGVAALAALMYHKVEVRSDMRVGVLITGGNMELSDLSYLIERNTANEGRRVRLWILINDRPESMKDVFDILGKNGLISENVFLDRHAHSVPMGYCELRIVATANQSAMVEKCTGELRERGYRVTVAY